MESEQSAVGAKSLFGSLIRRFASVFKQASSGVEQASSGVEKATKEARAALFPEAMKMVNLWSGEAKGFEGQAWIEIAKREVEAAALAAQKLEKKLGAGKATGLEKIVLSEGFGHEHGRAKLAADMFGFKHKRASDDEQEQRRWQSDPRPESALSNDLALACDDLALAALNARLVRRGCELMLGQWPRLSKREAYIVHRAYESGDYNVSPGFGLDDFAGFSDLWSRGRDGMCEPSLGLLHEAFGDGVLDATQAFEWGTEARQKLLKAQKATFETHSKMGYKPEHLRGEPRKGSQKRSQWSILAISNRKITEDLIAELDRSNPKLANGIKDALSDVRQGARPWGASETAARMFGFAWESRGVAAMDTEQDESGLANGKESLKALAHMAMVDKSASRLCEMALGRWPILDPQKEEGAIFRNFTGSGNCWHPEVDWVHNASDEDFAKHWEPSLRHLCELFGDSAVAALGRAQWSEHAKQRLSEHWKMSDYSAKSMKGLWKIKQGAAQVGKPTPFEKAGLAAGVPAYAMGMELAPAQRWLQAGLDEMLDLCQDQVWGENEPLRSVWRKAAKAASKSIGEASLSASYSDDSSCRQTEAQECAERTLLLEAHQALLDALARSRLADGNPYRLDRAQLDKACEAITQAKGPLAWPGSEASVFCQTCKKLGMPKELLSDSKELARMLPAWIEANEIRQSLGAGLVSEPKPAVKRL